MRRHGARLPIDPVLEDLARLEREHAARRDRHRRAGLWIAANPCVLVAQDEVAEA